MTINEQPISNNDQTPASGNNAAPLSAQGEVLKEEILRALRTEKSEEKRVAWGSRVVSSLLIVLLLIAVIQVVQSVSIWAKIKNGAVTPAAAASASTNVNEMPDMVGGC